MIRVLVVDDQQLVRQGFQIILESEPDITVVGEAPDGEQAVALALELAPDVICMDVEMPVMDGLEASRRIMAELPGTAILVLTTFGHERYLFAALAAGVSGFLLKTSRAEQLIDAVRALARGEALLGSDVTRAVIERVSAETGAPGVAGTVHDVVAETVIVGAAGDVTAEMAACGLTDREVEVLQLLALGQSNQEIASALFLGESTVKTHVSNLLRKLGVRDRIQAVVWAHTRGVS